MHINAKEKFLLANLAGQPISATTPFLTQNLKAKIYDGDTQDRDFDGLDSGQDVAQIMTNESNAFDFDVDFVASGAAGTAPAASLWLQACGFKETVTAATDVTYTKEDINAIKSADLEMRHMVERGGSSRDYLYKTTNAKGQLGLTLKNKEIPMLSITGMRGDYYTPSDVAGVDPDDTLMDALKANLALPADGDNTLIFKIGTHNICASEFSCSNLAGFITARASALGGCKYTAITAGLVDFTMTFLAPDWNTEFNPFALAETGNGVQQFPFQIVHGVDAGEILDLSSPAIQVLPGTVEESEIEGELAFSVNCRVRKPFVLVAK